MKTLAFLLLLSALPLVAQSDGLVTTTYFTGGFNWTIGPAGSCATKGPPATGTIALCGEPGKLLLSVDGAAYVNLGMKDVTCDAGSYVSGIVGGVPQCTPLPKMFNCTLTAFSLNSGTGTSTASLTCQ